MKIGDIEGTMTKSTDSGIEVETANGETKNIAMKGLNESEGCEVNGKKVKIKTPQNKRGAFLGVGEMVGECKIKKITKSEVIFSLKANGKEYTHSIPR